MKKILFLSFLSLLIISLILPSVLALTLVMKDNYQPGETMLIQIQGNVEPISLNQIAIKRINIGIVTDFDVKKIGDNYYIWAQAPLAENNYTLTIKNISALVLGKPQNLDFSMNFTVSGTPSDYSISPGFISTNKDFSIELNLNLDTPKTIDLNFPIQQSVILMPGINKIPFSISSINQTQLIQLTIGKYIIPAYITSNKSVSTPISAQNPLKFIPRIIDDGIPAGSSKTYTIQLLNSGSQDSLDISLNYSNSAFSIDYFNTFNLASGDVVLFNLTINSSAEDYIRDNITAESENNKIVLPIQIQFIHGIFNSTLNTTLQTNTTLYKCVELSGSICTPNQICSGKTVQSLDGFCCTKLCTELSSPTSYSWLGWLLAIIILVVLVYVGWKYIKAKPNQNPISQKVNELEKKTK